MMFNKLMMIDELRLKTKYDILGTTKPQYIDMQIVDVYTISTKTTM